MDSEVNLRDASTVLGIVVDRCDGDRYIVETPRGRRWMRCRMMSFEVFHDSSHKVEISSALPQLLLFVCRRYVSFRLVVKEVQQPQCRVNNK